LQRIHTFNTCGCHTIIPVNGKYGIPAAPKSIASLHRHSHLTELDSTVRIQTPLSGWIPFPLLHFTGFFGAEYLSTTMRTRGRLGGVYLMDESGIKDARKRALILHPFPFGSHSNFSFEFVHQAWCPLYVAPSCQPSAYFLLTFSRRLFFFFQTNNLFHF